jgi:hypothetical protein
MNRLNEIAAQLDGVEYRNEETFINQKQLAEEGIVVAFGASDDLLELRGAIDDEYGAWEGISIMLIKTKDGEIKALSWEEFHDNRSYIGGEFERHITAKWCPKDTDASWKITPSCEHATFNVEEDGDLYCTGAVFYLKDALKEL